MDISQVAKATGLPSSTLRYYEQKRLIRSIGRVGLKRYFASDVMEKLALINLGQSAGLSLDEIGRMFTLQGVVVDRELLVTKADETDKQVTRLVAMRDGLRHAANCNADNHLNCPKFLRLLNITSKKAGKEKSRKPREQIKKVVLQKLSIRKKNSTMNNLPRKRFIAKLLC